MKKLVILLICLIFTSSVQAVPELQESSSYEIEVLVFKHLQLNENDNELWPMEVSPEILADLNKAVPAGGSIPADSPLNDAMKKMSESGRYLVVSQKKWVQDALPKTEAQLIRVANPEFNLDGTVLFYKSRFLHLDVNLMLAEEFIPVSNQNPQNGGNSTENSKNYFMINEKRRIRSDQLNFFDHPRFGIIIRVNPVKLSKG